MHTLSALVCMNLRMYLYYSLGADQRILIWDIGSAAQVCELKGHSDSVYQLVFSRDGSILTSGGLDNCVKLWDASGFDGDGNTVFYYIPHVRTNSISCRAT